MKNTSLLAQRISAAAVGLLGLIVICRWVFRLAWLDLLFPGAGEMGLTSPVMFFIAGTALFQVALAFPHKRRSGHVQLALIAVLAGLSSAVLLEHCFDLNLGVDFTRVPTPPTPETPHPGRPAPNTGLAFLLAAGSLYLGTMGKRTKLQNRLFTALTAAVMVIAFSALAGHFLGLSTLYRVAAYNRMLLSAAFGLSILGLGLWFMMQRLSDHLEASAATYERRIATRSLIILALVALSTGVAGFAVMRDGLEKAASDNLFITATSNAVSLTNTLDARLWFPKTMSTRPSVVQAFALLAANPEDAKPHDFLVEVGNSFLTAGIDNVRFESLDGKLLAESGTRTGKDAKARIALNPAMQSAALLWKDGYLLEAQNTVSDGGRVVGRILTEQRLPAFDALVAGIQKGGPTSEVVICGLDKKQALCAPSRFTPAPRRIPLAQLAGAPMLAANPSALTTPSMFRMTDVRGVSVMAAYAPLTGFGLAMIVKVDVDTVYAPLRKRIAELAGIVLALALLGGVATRLQVQPVLRQLVREQTRNKVILANSNDAFVALGRDGTVTDWNAQAEAMFGWSAAEAGGRQLAELIIPAEHRAAHNAGLKRFTETGTGTVINRRIEVTALRRDGSAFPAELSVTGYHDGIGYVSNAFVRDITERKLNESRLVENEQRLRLIADNLPVLISYIDQHHRLQFGNATYKDWLGVDPAQFIGHPVIEVIGRENYAERRMEMERALTGETVRFEVTSSANGVVRHLQTVYVPHRDPAGTIQGIYTLSTDITSQKEIERHLSALARIDSLTGLPNRRQFDERLCEALYRYRRHPRHTALMFLDIDHFKKVNDTYGHGIGDEVLKQFADRLRATVRATDMVARLAGDEFVIILDDLHGAEEADLIAGKIIAAMQGPMQADGIDLTMSTSIGIAVFEPDTIAPHVYVARADEALYRSKGAGRGRFCRWTRAEVRQENQQQLLRQLPVPPG